MPPTVDKVAKRAELIRIAAEVFSRSGYHETKMQDIATAADVGKGTMYEYFRTKEELFLGVYDLWMSAFEDQVRRAVEEAADPMAKADAVRDSAVAFYESRADQAPLLLEFWAHALRTDNPAFLERIRVTRRFLNDLGRQITRDLVQTGWFVDIDAISFTELESGISDGIFLSWVLSGRSFPLGKAYTFRQSVMGLGLLTDQGRVVLRDRLEAKLKKGF